MRLSEQEMRIPSPPAGAGLLDHLARQVLQRLDPDETPVRLVLTGIARDAWDLELGVLSGTGRHPLPDPDSIFAFRRRPYENAESFNAVLLVPTGIGAELGGHSGDAGAMARLLASACDELVTHPNVMNAADINELPDNAHYVEGSVISRLLMGTVGLRKVRSNRVALVVDRHADQCFVEAAINSASAARVALGLRCPLVVRMSENILMRSLYATSGRAVGLVENLDALCDVLEEHREQFDAVALSTLVQVPSHLHVDYFKDGAQTVVNPWGGVEAMLTHAVSLLFDVPSAHSPMMSSKDVRNLELGVVDPRKAADTVSMTYLHCLLKGLHRSPCLVSDPALIGQAGQLTARDVSCLVIPDGCVGLPTLAALEQGIPVVAVRENTSQVRNRLDRLPFASDKLFVVENYLEAVGLMQAMRCGVAPDTVRRPLAATRIVDQRSD